MAPSSQVDLPVPLLARLRAESESHVRVAGSFEGPLLAVEHQTWLLFMADFEPLPEERQLGQQWLSLD